MILGKIDVEDMGKCRNGESMREVLIFAYRVLDTVCKHTFRNTNDTVPQLKGVTMFPIVPLLVVGD